MNRTYRASGNGARVRLPSDDQAARIRWGELDAALNILPIAGAAEGS